MSRILETRITPANQSLARTFAEIWESSELLWVLIVRQIRVRYAQTAFGAFWVVLQPLLASALYTLVFGFFVKVPTGGVPYVLFSYAGMVSWSVFSQGFDRAGLSLYQDERLITKTYFPRLLLPIAAALSVVPDLVISTVLMLPVAWAMGYPPGPSLVWLVPAMFPAFLLSMGVGAIVASMNIRWRDLRQAAPFLVQVWVWATPVAYPVTLAPRPWDVALLANPMAAPVMLYRHAMIGTPLPPAWSVAWSIAASIILFLVGVLVFRGVEKTFADYI